MFHALSSIKVGALLPTAGPDLMSAQLGMTFGVPELAEGLNFATLGKAAKRPEEFGDGGIKDVAGPESANNARAADVVHPAADAGLPSNSVTPEIGRKRREIFVEED